MSGNCSICRVQTLFGTTRCDDHPRFGNCSICRVQTLFGTTRCGDHPRN